MPVRQGYGIRTSLGKNRLQTQVQLGGTNLSMGKKPFTIGSFLIAIGAGFAYMMIASRTVVRHGGILGWILFTLGYIGCYYAFFTRTATLDYRFTLLPRMVDYWRRGGREISTLYTAPGAPIRALTGLDVARPVEKDGKLNFTNGEVGYILDVVGNASSLIFEADQVQVIRDTRTIYKNLPSMVGLTTITQASTQDVHDQLESKVIQLRNLQIDSPGLRQVVKKQGQALRDVVGTHFSMIRQYILIRGAEDAVKTEKSVIMNAANSQTNQFLKQARVLTNEEPRKGVSGMVINRPKQVEKLLASIFNDYAGK